MSSARSYIYLPQDTVGLRSVAQKVIARKRKAYESLKGSSSDGKVVLKIEPDCIEFDVKKESIDHDQMETVESDIKTESKEQMDTKKNADNGMDVDETDKSSPEKCSKEQSPINADTSTKNKHVMVPLVRKSLPYISVLPDKVDVDYIDVSKAMLERTYYTKHTKPYSRLDALLDRRLKQDDLEKRQRFALEQQIAIKVQKEKSNVSPAKPIGGAKKVLKFDVDDESSKGATEAKRYCCYSALCRSDANWQCYSPVCVELSEASLTKSELTMSMLNGWEKEESDEDEEVDVEGEGKDPDRDKVDSDKVTSATDKTENASKEAAPCDYAKADDGSCTDKDTAGGDKGTEDKDNTAASVDTNAGGDAKSANDAKDSEGKMKTTSDAESESLDIAMTTDCLDSKINSEINNAKDVVMEPIDTTTGDKKTATDIPVTCSDSLPHASDENEDTATDIATSDVSPDTTDIDIEADVDASASDNDVVANNVTTDMITFSVDAADATSITDSPGNRNSKETSSDMNESMNNCMENMNCEPENNITNVSDSQELEAIAMASDDNEESYETSSELNSVDSAVALDSELSQINSKVDSRSITPMECEIDLTEESVTPVECDVDSTTEGSISHQVSHHSPSSVAESKTVSENLMEEPSARDSNDSDLITNSTNSASSSLTKTDNICNSVDAITMNTAIDISDEIQNIGSIASTKTVDASGMHSKMDLPVVDDCDTNIVSGQASPRKDSPDVKVGSTSNNDIGSLVSGSLTAGGELSNTSKSDIINDESITSSNDPSEIHSATENLSSTTISHSSVHVTTAAVSIASTISASTTTSLLVSTNSSSAISSSTTNSSVVSSTNANTSVSSVSSTTTNSSVVSSTTTNISTTSVVSSLSSSIVCSVVSTMSATSILSSNISVSSATVSCGAVVSLLAAKSKMSTATSVAQSSTAVVQSKPSSALSKTETTANSAQAALRQTIAAMSAEELRSKIPPLRTTKDKFKLVRLNKIGRKGKGIKKGSLPVCQKFQTISKKKSVLILETYELKRLARKAGHKETPGFNYNCKMNHVNWVYPCPRPTFRTAWRYRTQTLRTLAAAALQLRILWSCLRWDDMAVKAPAGGTNTTSTESQITTTELLKRRDIGVFGLRSEFLVREIVVPIGLPSTPKGK